MSSATIPQVSAEEPVVRDADLSDGNVGRVPIADRKTFGKAAERRIGVLIARQREAERRADWYAQLSDDLVTMCRELFTIAKAKLDRQSQAEFLQELMDVQKEMLEWQTKR
jgi:septum formation topological specificity factor MinE